MFLKLTLSNDLGLNLMGRMQQRAGIAPNVTNRRTLLVSPRPCATLFLIFVAFRTCLNLSDVGNCKVHEYAAGRSISFNRYKAAASKVAIRVPSQDTEAVRDNNRFCMASSRTSYQQSQLSSPLLFFVKVWSALRITRHHFGDGLLALPLVPEVHVDPVRHLLELARLGWLRFGQTCPEKL